MTWRVTCRLHIAAFSLEYDDQATAELAARVVAEWGFHVEVKRVGG